MIVVGIDPGASGATALLRDGGGLVTVADMPVAEGRVMPALLADFLIDYVRAGNGIEAWVENVSSMPGQGVASTFKFGRSVGVCEGVLGALGIPVRWVTPAKWKGALGLSKDKGASRRRAMELWPDHAHLFARVKDDGRAEAALIAWYGARQA